MTRGKAVFYLVSIFLAGVLTGAFAGYGWGRHWWAAPPQREKMVENVCAMLRKELSLSDEQLSRIRPLIEQTSLEIHAIHTNTMARIEEAVNLNDQRMGQFLTPEQKEKLAQMQAKRRERKHEGGRPPKN